MSDPVIGASRKSPSAFAIDLPFDGTATTRPDQRRRPDPPAAGASRPGCKALADAGWLRALREVVPAVTCTAQASILTGRAAAGARHRRQRLALPRHGRGPVLAAVERPDPGRAALRDRAAAGRRAGPELPRGQALLVVQPGGGRRRSASRPSPTTGPTATRPSASPARPRA